MVADSEAECVDCIVNLDIILGVVLVVIPASSFTVSGSSIALHHCEEYAGAGRQSGPYAGINYSVFKCSMAGWVWPSRTTSSKSYEIWHPI